MKVSIEVSERDNFERWSMKPKLVFKSAGSTFTANPKSVTSADFLFSRFPSIPMLAAPGLTRHG